MEELLREVERQQRRPQARHVAVVVRSPHVEGAGEAAVALVPMIRDVGKQVRVRAVGLAEHTVLVVPERRRPEPERAVLLVRMPASGEVRERALEALLPVQLGLREHNVELHAERAQVLVLLGPLGVQGDHAAAPHSFVRGQVGKPAPFAA